MSMGCIEYKISCISSRSSIGNYNRKFMYESTNLTKDYFHNNNQPVLHRINFHDA